LRVFRAKASMSGLFLGIAENASHAGVRFR
jgi:hypothetical protein